MWQLWPLPLKWHKNLVDPSLEDLGQLEYKEWQITWPQTQFTWMPSNAVVPATLTAMHPLLLLSFLASALSVPLSQVVIRHIFISIGTNFIWAEVSLTCRSWLRHGWKLVVAPISSLKTWNLGIVFFSQYYVVTKYSFWRQIISVCTGDYYMYVKDRCSTVDHGDMSGLDGWDGTLGGVGRTLHC